nr:hypothetical protein Iba_chr11cCG1860 [Ipomoea batatas]
MTFCSIEFPRYDQQMHKMQNGANQPSQNSLKSKTRQHSSGAALQFSLLFQFLQKDPYGSGNMYQLIPNHQPTQNLHALQYNY